MVAMIIALIFIFLFFIIYKVLSFIDSKSNKKLTLLVSAFSVVGVIATFTDAFRIPIHSFLSEILPNLPFYSWEFFLLPTWAQVIIYSVVVIVGVVILAIITEIIEHVIEDKKRLRRAFVDVNAELKKLDVIELKKIAKNENIANYTNLNKEELIGALSGIKHVFLYFVCLARLKEIYGIAKIDPEECVPKVYTKDKTTLIFILRDTRCIDLYNMKGVDL